MTPPCPVTLGALVKIPGGHVGRVVEIRRPCRSVMVDMGDYLDLFGWGELSPATTYRPPQPPRKPRRPRPGGALW